MLRIRDIRLTLDEDPAVLKDKVRKLLKISDFELTIERESLDARRRSEPFFTYTVAVSLAAGETGETAKTGETAETAETAERRLAKRPGITYFEPETPQFPHGKEPLTQRPIVMGFGPAGLFAAWLLAKEGYKPIVFERGAAIRERREKVEAFWAGQAPLDPETNVQFGEGGAGTFSDGKLTSRSKDPYARLINEVFVQHGAPADILYSFQPHIGTDLLAKVIVSMREEMIQLGAEIHFNTPVTEITIEEGRLAEIKTPNGTYRGPLLMGIGHSARDTFRMLTEKGVASVPKAFAVGLRIEHPQTLIDEIRYGKFAGHPRLGVASFQVHSTMRNERNAYSFCMCPGGLVVAAASEEGRLVTNGMSYHARDLANANSAILTSVQPGRDFGTGILDGVHYQEQLEEAAFHLGGGSFTAPIQTVTDYLKSFDLSIPKLQQRAEGNVPSVRGNDPSDRAEGQNVRNGGQSRPHNPHNSSNFNVQGNHYSRRAKPSYRPDVREAELKSLFSDAMGRAIAEGLIEIDSKLPGFAGEAAILTGVESRSSSPIRFVRNQETRESVNVSGLYPIGEGAGYAGGIVSAALDGLRTAEKIIANFAPPL